MRTTVSRTFHFEAAHQLPWHEGKCRYLHGHSYRLQVTVAGPVGPNGIVIDFADLRAVVEREVIDRFDHRYLNDLMDNPTAELIAEQIYQRLGAAGLDVALVRLWETEDSMVEVAPA
jgi:6-pyruvoyltetrahydropterin/6-carboxytetrahydropterin synthase